MRTSPYPPMRWAYAAAYASVLLWIVARLKAIPEIRSVDLKKPARGHHYGSSDLDLLATTVPLSAPDFFAVCDRLAKFLQPAGSWRRIIDLYLFSPGELELKRRLDPNSIAPRLTHIFGPNLFLGEIAAPSHKDDLGRAMYAFTSLCQEVLEGPLDPHRMRIVYRTIEKLDRELPEAARRHVDVALRAEILRMPDDPVVRGRIAPAHFAEAARAFSLAFDEVNALCDASALAPIEGCADHRRDHFSQCDLPIRSPLLPESLRPETLDLAIASCKPAVAAMCASFDDAILSAIIGCNPGASYEYRIYLILREELSNDRRMQVLRAVRELFAGPATYQNVPADYFRLRAPILMTPAMWRATSDWSDPLRSAEEFYFLQRHGAVLWGEDVRAQLRPPTYRTMMRSAGIAVSDLRNIIWETLYRRGSSRLADVILGRIPALWLLLSRSRVATSPGEALRGCLAGGFPHADVLEQLSDQIVGLPPRKLPRTDDAIWKPALGALTEWLDAVMEMALCKVR